MAALVDTTVVIDLANGHDGAMTFCNTVLRQSETIYISNITVMEVLVGARNKKELDYLTTLLSIFTTLPLTEDISSIATGLIKHYHLAHGLLIPDALIAATALVENLDFFTNNIKDFRAVAHLNVEKPY